jgi:predicted XRE-type DNA-binding protein
MNQDFEREESSGNVFADLNIPQPEETLAKAKLAHRICTIIEERGLTQTQAADILDVGQPKISALMHGHLDGFSTDRLFRFLNAFHQDIEITIKPHPNPHEQAEIRVY